MLNQGGGAIVNTSSGAGIRGFGGGAAYTAAKHGVIGLTKDAAVDYAQANIRVNAVCPGIIDTEMMQRHTGGTSEGRDRVIASEPVGRMGNAGGDCRRRALAVLGCGHLRHRTRHGRRRRPNGVTIRCTHLDELTATLTATRYRISPSTKIITHNHPLDSGHPGLSWTLRMDLRPEGQYSSEVQQRPHCLTRSASSRCVRASVNMATNGYCAEFGTLSSSATPRVWLLQRLRKTYSEPGHGRKYATIGSLIYARRHFLGAMGQTLESKSPRPLPN
jgi:hypothetical protein